MKRQIATATATLAIITSLTAFGAWAEEESPFGDALEIRHGLMLQMASDLGVMGDMAKGKTEYDAAAASKAAANIAAISSVLGMEQFPEGSENGKLEDSFALPAIWANTDDFLMKVTDLQTAAGGMTGAAGQGVDALKAQMGSVAGACMACHKAYRQPEE